MGRVMYVMDGCFSETGMEFGVCRRFAGSGIRRYACMRIALSVDADMGSKSSMVIE